MGLKVSGCCGMNLRGAGYAHGCLGLIILALLIISNIQRIIYFDPNKILTYRSYEDYRPEVTRTLNGEIVSLVMLLFDALVSALLIAGILKNKHNMLLPWLVLRAIGLLISIPLVLLYLLFASLSGESDAIIGALVVVLITCLFVWSWIVIYSLYREIRSSVKKPLQRLPVPYIESGQIVQQPPYQKFNK